MGSPKAIRAGLAANAYTLGTVNTYRNVPEAVEPPCVLILPDQPFFEIESMGRGHFSYYFRALLLVASTISDQAQDMLDDYLSSSGTGSLRAALEVDKTLGGIAENATVTACTTYGDVEWNDLRYWGAELTVRVLTTG